MNFTALSNLMMAGTSFASALNGAQSARLQGDFARKQGEQNAALARRQADDAVKRGVADANQQRSKARRLQAEQRVALAANGNDVASGSAALIQDDSRLMGEIDAMTIQNNAYREAWGYQTQAIQSELQGKFSQIAGNATATNALIKGTLLTGAYGLNAWSGGSSNLNVPGEETSTGPLTKATGNKYSLFGGK